MSELKTCFKKVDYDLNGLLHYIDIGDIGLPDIQRPFVWANAKVRDLFDSMYRGFPVGYFLFWENPSITGAKQIGVGSKQHPVPHRLIVDGQQRLTSLFAVFRGHKVLDNDYQERQIEIAFRPRDGKFEVADAAVRRDPEWISNISLLWTSGQSSYQMVKGFLKQLTLAKGELKEEEEERLSHNLDRLFDLQKYPFTALEIATTVDEEQVADIFVRINSEGVRLKQADFILTLMSVFWDEGRSELEKFCRSARQAPSPGSPPTPFNHFIQPDPDQLLRVAVAFGFNRGRLKSVYQVLRGKDMDTGEFSNVRREEQFALLQSSQAEVLKLKHWHQFLSSLIGAGFRSAEMISSQSALLYAYSFYLIGRQRFGVPEHRLQRLIGRWFFSATLTGRYTSSPETTMDGDLNLVKAAKDADGFEALLEDLMASVLTNDFWTVTLPYNLNSSSARNPELFAYMAAQNRLGSPVLFSHKRISDLLDPSIRSSKKALERHHLFPRAWLERNGVDDLKQINQVANFALLEWPDNIDVSDDPPFEYAPVLRERFSASDWSEMHDRHALPVGWESMSYERFLDERRKLMAGIIRRGYQSLQVQGGTHPAMEESVDLSTLPSVVVAVQNGKVNSQTPSNGEEADEEEETDDSFEIEELTPIESLRLRFWSAFFDSLRESNSPIKPGKPRPQQWTNFSIGRTSIHLGAVITTSSSVTGSDSPEIRAQLYIGGKRSKRIFAILESRKDEIERTLGFPLTWYDNEGRKVCRLLTRTDADFTKEALWPQQFEWLRAKLETMHKVFAPIVRDLRIDAEA